MVAHHPVQARRLLVSRLTQCVNVWVWVDVWVWVWM
jgi:hypothetical protein